MNPAWVEGSLGIATQAFIGFNSVVISEIVQK